MGLMEMAGGLDVQGSIPYWAEQAFPLKWWLSLENHPPQQKGRSERGNTSGKTLTHSALEIGLSHLPRKLLEEHSTEKSEHTHRGS